MKNKLALGLLLLFGAKTFSQGFVDSLKTVLKKNNLVELNAFLEKNKNKDVQAILNRQIIDNYTELTFEVRESPGYQIHVIGDGDKLIYSRVISDNKKLSENQEGVALKQFYKKYEAFFGTKVKASSFFADSIRYGRGCGFAGVDPPERKKLKSLVAAKDSKELSKWLQSTVTEKQLYAVEGFSELAKNGFKVGAQQQKWIDFIKTKKGNYQDCNGCIYSSTAIVDHFKKTNN